MGWTTSVRERWLWIAAGLLLVGIAASLAITPDLATEIRRSGLSAPFFTAGMVGIAVGAVMLGRVGRGVSVEVVIVTALVAVALLGVARAISAAERTHLIEYGALALLVHAALLERSRHRPVPRIGLTAAAIAAAVGLVDELVQVVIPSRVFDPVDVLFNASAAAGAVLTVALVRRVGARRDRR